MSHARLARSPVAPFAAALALLAVADFLAAALFQLGMRGMAVSDPFEFLIATLAEFVTFLLGAGVVVGGVSLVLAADRTALALLAVATAAFGCFLALSVLWVFAAPGPGGLAMALSHALERTALLAALALVAVAARDAAADASSDATPTE